MRYAIIGIMAGIVLSAIFGELTHDDEVAMKTCVIYQGKMTHEMRCEVRDDYAIVNHD